MRAYSERTVDLLERLMKPARVSSAEEYLDFWHGPKARKATGNLLTKNRHRGFVQRAADGRWATTTPGIAIVAQARRRDGLAMAIARADFDGLDR